MDEQVEWLEIRPYIEREVEPANMEPIINYAFKDGEAFEAAVGCMRNPGDPAEKRVRYFLKAPDPETHRTLKRQLENQGFYITTKNQPNFEDEYPHEVELEAADDYAERFFKVPSLPITREDVNERGFRPDRPDIAGSLAGAISSGGTLRIAFKEDQQAVNHVSRYADNVLRKGSGYTSPLEEFLITLGDIIFYGSEERKERREPPQELAESSSSQSTYFSPLVMR